MAFWISHPMFKVAEQSFSRNALSAFKKTVHACNFIIIRGYAAN